MGDEGTVEDKRYEVHGVFGWQGKMVVAFAKARMSEEDMRE